MLKFQSKVRMFWAFIFLHFLSSNSVLDFFIKTFLYLIFAEGWGGMLMTQSTCGRVSRQLAGVGLLPLLCGFLEWNPVTKFVSKCLTHWDISAALDFFSVSYFEDCVWVLGDRDFPVFFLAMCCFVSFCFVTQHPQLRMALSSFQPTMTLNFWSSCLHLTSARISGCTTIPGLFSAGHQTHAFFFWLTCVPNLYVVFNLN